MIRTYCNIYSETF